MVDALFSPRLVCLIFIAVSCVFSCTRQMSERQSVVSNKEITIEGADGPLRFTIEVADTEKKRALGLMYRKNLDRSHGMLFVFDDEKIHPFWMKNTYVPLDLIFFDENWKIVGVIENAQPLNEDNLSIDEKSRYVLEVLAGTVKKHGIKKGGIGRLIQR